MNITNQRLAIVGDDTARSNFLNHLADWYPGLDPVTADKLNCEALEVTPLAVPPYATRGGDSVVVGGGEEEARAAGKHENLFGEPGDDGAAAAATANPGVVLEFDSESSMESYATSSSYGRGDHPAIYAAVVLSSEGPDWSYTIRGNSSFLPPLQPGVNPYQRDMTQGTIDKYLFADWFSPASAMPGASHDLLTAPASFSSIQLAVDRYILGTAAPSNDSGSSTASLGLVAATLLEFNCSGALDDPILVGKVADLLRSTTLSPQRVQVTPFPITAFKGNQFFSAVSQVFGLFLVLGYFYPVSQVIGSIVSEKETKIREGMQMMGMAPGALGGAWLLYFFTQFGVIAIISATLLNSTMLKHSSGGLLLLQFWLFGLSCTALGYLLSTFFSRSKIAAVVGTIVYVAAFFPYFAVDNPEKGHGGKIAASILSPVAFGIGLQVVSDVEANGVGLTMANVNTPVDNVTFAETLLMLAVDTVLYLALGWYFDNVIPQEFGVAKPWYFPVSPDYWCGEGGMCPMRTQPPADYDNDGRQRIPSGTSSVTSAGMEDESDRGVELRGKKPLLAAADGAGEGLSPVGTAKQGRRGAVIEGVGSHLKQLANQGRNIKVRGLRKEFDTPDGIKVAVDDLDIDMYEGQVFALLGLNGAGKSTTISMLTGLIGPSKGYASIKGTDITTGMDKIRQSMGVCPQHDVLWGELTVKEHLQFFAALKGVPADEVDKEVAQKIREVGLTEKVEAPSASLSGGMKRKLSVAIALIGGSKVVFLDECTSGMDPWSRRSTWEVIQNNKDGRIIVMTTHFMDEADILGDRIGIMADGRVRCCGSSMFLKQHFGVGYNLTMVKE